MPEIVSTNTLTAIAPGAPNTNNTGPTWPRGLHDSLMTPAGSTIGLTSTESLRPQLAKLGIRDAHTRPRDAIVEDYYQMMRKVHDEAGSAAVDAWLHQQHRG